MNNVITSVLEMIRVGLGLTSPTNIFVPDDLDWEKTVEFAKSQGVVAVIGDALTMMTDVRVSDIRSLKRIVSLTQKTEKRYNRNLLAIKPLVDAWHDAGLRVVVLKGVAFGQYYPTPQHRFASDVDVMLFDANRALCECEKGDKIAKEIGAVVENEMQKHSHIHINGVMVENHYHCCGQIGDKKIHELDDFLISLLKEKSHCLDGTWLECPQLMFDALFCLFHAYGHFIIEGNIQLRHIIDWMLIRRKVEADGKKDDFMLMCEKYDLMKFYDAMDGVARYVGGDIQENDMNTRQKLMFTDIIADHDNKENSEEHHSIMRKRLAMIPQIWDNRWKYPLYTETSVYGMFWTYIKTYLRRIK